MDAGSFALAILSLGFLIVVHEAGHYVVARWCKMRVERFSIGFGPGILKHKGKHGTVFQLAPLPFGGFVEIRGMNIAEDVDPEDLQAYPNRPAWQRFLTILAGPATNYLSAIVLAFVLYNCHGMNGDTSIIGEVTEGYDAKGKLEVNDRIIQVNGQPLFSPDSVELSKAIRAGNGAPVNVMVLRNDVPITVSIKPQPMKDKDNNVVYETDSAGNKVLVDGIAQPHLILGVKLEQDVVDVSTGTAAQAALTFPIRQTKLILNSLKEIFTGKEELDTGGPVRIVKEFKSAFAQGIWHGIGLLMALSVYLGLFNLFPLPALDGGRLVFLSYEMVTRRRANPKIETMVHMGGIMVLMVVMILVTLRDVNVF